MTSPNATTSLTDISADSPPPGVSLVFESPHSHGLVVIIVGSIFLATMLLFVSVRIYTKIKVVRKSSPDDYTCFIAAIGTVGYFILLMFAITAIPRNLHEWESSASDVSKNSFLLINMFSNTVSVVVFLFAKLSFFLLYIQLFRPMDWLRYSAYAGAVVNIFFYVLTFALALIYSVPRSGQTLQQAFESPRQAHNLARALPTACINLVLDIYILVLPIAGMSKLQLPMRNQLEVIAVFLTGLLACVASSISIFFNVALRKDLPQLTYNGLFVMLSTVVEMCVGVTVSCMPSMSNLLHHLPNWTFAKWRLHTLFSVKSTCLVPGEHPGSRPLYKKSKRADHADLEAVTTVFRGYDHELESVKSTQICIEAGSAHRMEENGSHKIQKERSGSGDSDDLHPLQLEHRSASETEFS